MTMAEGIQILSQYEISAHDRATFAYSFLPFYGEGEQNSNPPGDGWDTYSLFYIPDHVDLNEATVGYAPYYLSLAAATGFMEYLRVHPDDLHAMDRP